MEYHSTSAQASGHVTLTFNSISYHVLNKAKSRGQKAKQILQEVSGSCSSGRLVALMGPSGAGKTSLLDILAGVKVSGTCDGTILINGAPKSPAARCHLSGYVQQRDVLMPSATVYEALTTSALLKLPYSMDKAQKLQRVEDLLDALDLRKVADTLIGDETMGVKGISGGEKRRTSVGIELIQDPPIIFLDEPTTGLDSKMALDVMAVLHKLAVAGKMVVCTIHQPNSDITDLFHDWMLLAEGRLLYAGAWSGALGYFEALGHPCPPYKCPADFFMTLASDSSKAALLSDSFSSLSSSHCQKALTHTPLADTSHCFQESEGSSSQTAHPDLRGVSVSTASSPAVLVEIYEAADNTKGSHRQLQALQLDSQTATAYQADPQWLTPQQQQQQQQECCWGSSCGPWWSDSAPKRSTPAWYQTSILMQRFFKSWWRTPILIVAEAAEFIILGVFLGLLYLRSPLKLPHGPSDRLGAITLGLVLLIFIPSYTAVIVWDYERRMLRRESEAGMYSRAAFFLAKTVVTTLMEIVLVTLFAGITFLMVGYQQDPLRFLIYWGTLQLAALCSETLGILCMLVTRDSKVGVELVTVILVFLMSFNGFLVKQIPVYFRWISKASFFSYASDIMVTNEFEGLQFAVAGAPGYPVGITSVDAMDFVPEVMHTGLSLSGNMGVLLGITVGMRLLAWLVLEVVARLRLL